MPSIGHVVLDGFAAFGMLSVFWLICVGARVLMFDGLERHKQPGDYR